VAFQERELASSNLNFSASILSGSFTAANSVLNGINKIPNQTTGGEGAVTGQEVLFESCLYSAPFLLPADHYFFIPQVELSSGDFLWLSARSRLCHPARHFYPICKAGLATEDPQPGLAEDRNGYRRCGDGHSGANIQCGVFTAG
jgi:hypothetical protein